MKITRYMFFKRIMQTADTGETMVIRSCSLDSGSLTLDTELVRMSHCGSFVMEGRSERR